MANSKQKKKKKRRLLKCSSSSNPLYIGSIINFYALYKKIILFCIFDVDSSQIHKTFVFRISVQNKTFVFRISQKLQEGGDGNDSGSTNNSNVKIKEN